jgi:hypothetical protein
MNIVENNESKQIIVVEGTNNALGEAVAAMILGYRSNELKGKTVRAERVKNDHVLGDYINISFDNIDEDGCITRSVRSVSILPTPSSDIMMKHVVRFTNFNFVEEQREIYLLNVRALMFAIIEYLITGELLDEEL